MRAQSSADRATWRANYEKEQKAMEAEERTTEFVASVRRGDLNSAQIAFDTHPGSKRQIRDGIEKSLLVGIDTGEISPEQAISYYENQRLPKMVRRRPWQEAFPLQYQCLWIRLTRHVLKKIMSM